MIRQPQPAQVTVLLQSMVARAVAVTGLITSAGLFARAFGILSPLGTRSPGRCHHGHMMQPLKLMPVRSSSGFCSVGPWTHSNDRSVIDNGLRLYSESSRSWSRTSQLQLLVDSDSEANAIAASGHLPLVKTMWAQLIKGPNDMIIVDATAGHGQDAAYLAQLLHNRYCQRRDGEATWMGTGKLYCIDIQHSAIESTRQRLLQAFPTLSIATTGATSSASPQDSQLLSSLPDSNGFNVELIHGSHTTFPLAIQPGTISILAYNLGFLPVGRKKLTMGPGDQQLITTSKETTIASLKAAIGDSTIPLAPLIKPGGLITVTAYRGHPGGAEEALAVEEYFSGLDERMWRVFTHAPLNRPTAPVVYSVFRNHFKTTSTAGDSRL